MITQKGTMDEIISCNENSNPVLQYGYVQDLGDGRGYTCGRAGFTTSDGDALGVVEKYPPMHKFVEELTRLMNANSASIIDLELMGFKKAWEDASKDPAFNTIQDEVSDAEYYAPAVALAAQLGITTALGLLCLYDTSVQGGATGPDSMTDIADRTRVSTDQNQFITDYLVTRNGVLLNPQDPTTKDAWAQSVDRVTALQTLVDSGNWNLAGPISYTVYGDTFTVGV